MRRSGEPVSGQVINDVYWKQETKNPKISHPISTIASSSSKTLSQDSLIQSLVGNLKIIAMRDYKDCYLILAKDLEQLEKLLASFAKDVKVDRQIGLDPRLFHWNPSKHKNQTIIFKFTLRWVMRNCQLNRHRERHISGPKSGTSQPNFESDGFRVR